MLALTGVPAVLELLLLPFFPESPRYLLIQKGDEHAARKGNTLSSGNLLRRGGAVATLCSMP